MAAAQQHHHYTTSKQGQIKLMGLMQGADVEAEMYTGNSSDLKV
jgi:hypothetical protein